MLLAKEYLLLCEEGLLLMETDDVSSEECIFTSLLMDSGASDLTFGVLTLL